MLRAVAVLSSLLLLGGAFPAGADEIDDADTGVKRARRQRPTTAQPASDATRHHVSVLLSSVSDSDFDQTEFNGGIEYEFQFHRYVGVGAQLEGSSGVRSMVAVVPIFIHPWRGLRLTLGGGAILDEDQDSDGLLRLGAGYRFNLTERITFGPEYNADLEGGTDPDHVFGVRLGYRF